MPSISSTTIQPQAWRAFIPFGLSLLVLFAAKKSGTVLLYFVGGFLALLSLLLWWFLQQIKLTVDDAAITMKTKISTREFLWKDITKASVSYSFNGKRRITYWNFDTTVGQTLSFDVSQYAKADLKMVAQAVTAKCSHAIIDPGMINMAG